ncbi:nucleotide sugar dehydrogenase [Lagierella sp.]|uniref:nucleotide sugar dehydrogenase n=1 Tax=Lagierella sp. TaxID=2849657 RepID=UPI00261AEA33|nr:nucleotide sugar dehydrogenase [Lagierella sp.]
MINVIGLGYIGLPTALMLAKAGNKVFGTDIKEETVKKLSCGNLTFEEKGMDELFKKALGKDIEFGTKPIKTNFYIITAPTPYDKNSKKLDCSFVVKAVESILEYAEDNGIIVIESTVSPGAIDNYIRPIVEDFCKSNDKTLNICHAPERIIPGNMVYELIHNSRTIGADDKKIAEKVKSVYETFCKGEINFTDIPTAEMTKVIENTFRDVNIAFANELAKICKQGGLDVNEVIRIANKHPRVNILKPGPGIGGHCIPVDPWFLVGDYPLYTELIYKARQINDSMPSFVLDEIYDIMQENGIKDPTRVGLYGLTYKENIDDIRESPTLQILELQKRRLATPLKTYDPWIKEKIVENQYFNLDEFLKSVDLVVVLVAHDEIVENQDKLKDKIVYDTRNVIKGDRIYRL